jgi:hypothetical protein
MGTYALVKGAKTGNAGLTPVQSPNADFGNTSPGSKASIDVAMYGNVTMGAFVNGMAVGVFGINATSMATTGGNVVIGVVTNPGTGYNANTANFTPVATNGGSGASLNAIANSTTSAGKITGFNFVSNGSGYITAPTITIPPPANVQIGANSTYITTSNTILVASANSRFQANDQVFYYVATGNTSIVGLTGNTNYYVNFVNTSAITLATTVGGANIQLTANALSTETGHLLQGVQAKGYVDINSVLPQLTHTGWVVRREGTGGRAGRVTYETLVATGSIGVSGTTSTGVAGSANPTSNSSVDNLV